MRARLMNVFERSGDLVEMTAVSDLVNGWSGGIIQASRHGVFVTPTYLVIQLYNETLGRERLAARVESPTFDSSREGRGVPVLDVVGHAVGRRAAGSSCRAVNTSRERALTTTVTVTGVAVGAARHAPDADWRLARGRQQLPHARCGDGHARGRSRSGATFTVQLPPHSVSVLTLPRRIEAKSTGP